MLLASYSFIVPLKSINIVHGCVYPFAGFAAWVLVATLVSLAKFNTF